MQSELNRRDVIKTLGGAGLAAVFGARALDVLSEDVQAATTCLLSPEVTEGPYWVDGTLTRRNITEGKAGLPLVIRFTVLNAKTCKLIKNADVEIWHCDALGEYSGVNGAATRFLRGHQKSNATGKAEFLTIFPGWYRGRTPHIHMKVNVGGNAVHTGQIFFNERITAAVYKQQPYARRGRYDTPHASDNIIRASGRLDGGAEAQAAHRRSQGLRRHDRHRRGRVEARAPRRPGTRVAGARVPATRATFTCAAAGT